MPQTVAHDQRPELSEADGKIWDIRNGSDLNCLVGQELSAVSFVRDYVEFHFDGPILRSLTDPGVRLAGTYVTSADPGWRDALYSAIGGVVEHVAVLPHERIELRTTDGTQVTVPLRESARTGPEAAHFVPAEADGSLRIHNMSIW